MSFLLNIEIILFSLALIFAALFAFLETSFTALRLFKLKELQASVAKYKTLLSSWENNPQRILITILVANNFAHVMCSVLITQIMQNLLGSSSGLPIGIALATIIILLFGEIIPKSWAKAQHEKLFASSLWVINSLFHVLYPVVTILLSVADFFYIRWAGTLPREQQVTEKEIEFLIDYSDEQGLMETEKTEMLQNIFDLGTKLVRDIIIPQSDMVLLNVNATLEEAMNVFSKHRYSRLPVYEEREENIIGIIYQKDIFPLLSDKKKSSLRELIRPVLFVPATKKINQLLREFLEKRMHMAIVIDEYGSVDGLVTLEDVIEEIVGDINDEDEKVQATVIPLEKGGWLVEGRISLEKLAEILGVNFDVEESVTLAGFLSEKLQHLPRKGERFFYNGYCFQIQQASHHRVIQVLVFKDKTGDENQPV